VSAALLTGVSVGAVLVLAIGVATLLLTRRALVRALGKRAYRAVMGPPVTEDPLRAWKGTAAGGRNPLRVMHVGDCTVRAMDTSHDYDAPVGYPKAMAERLLDEGVGMEFAHYFAITYEYLPEIDRLEKITKLSGAPDLIIVHTGITYQRRLVLKSTQRVNQLRLDTGRRLGRHIFTAHPLLVRPLVRLFGRHWAPYSGTDLLDGFIDELERRWPQAKLVLMPPFPTSWSYPTSQTIWDEVLADGRALAERRGLPFMEFDELVAGQDDLYCVNGFNLNTRGSKLVGDELAKWVLAEVAETHKPAIRSHESDAHRRQHGHRPGARATSDT
jgi:hypothetical protein